MEIRPSEMRDLPVILRIYEEARAFMAAHGNPRQWGDSWPPEEVILQDIEEGTGFVCCEDGAVQGVFHFRFGKDDPTYQKIYEGAWKYDEPYGVIHRIASARGAKGAGSAALAWAFERCRYMRIDTHEDNRVMQNFLRKNGFTYSGIIYVREDNDPRLAYEKHL